jgi:hypothetical protein
LEWLLGKFHRTALLMPPESHPETPIRQPGSARGLRGAYPCLSRRRATIEVRIDDRVRHDDFSIVNSFDKSPIQQNGHILTDAAHVTAEIA